MRIAALIFAVAGIGLTALVLGNLHSGGFALRLLLPLFVVCSLFYLSNALVRGAPTAAASAAVAAIFLAFAAAAILSILFWHSSPGEVRAMFTYMPGTLAALSGSAVAFTVAAVLLIKARRSQPNNRIERAREP